MWTSWTGERQNGFGSGVAKEQRMQMNVVGNDATSGV